MPKLTREELLQQTLGRYAKRMENLLYELNEQVVESKLIASEPEPVAWMNPNEESDGYAFSHTYWEGGVFTVPLYTAPKKAWVDLTATEVKILRNASNTDREFAALVIAKFKEKNT